ncbi:MAG: sigma 54-interacting transcriptional regulator [Spirochaetaceae bacterium]|jgi:transcriptional regulator with PAS, ATPase and Fis domain|nr:sigma 54-interacting transcriptional regulator [Spirochaetaceae bacterium]
MIFSDETRALFDAMSEGIVYIDLDGRIIFANAAYRHFLEIENNIRDDQRVEGFYLKDLRPKAQLPSVVKSGVPVLHAPRREKKDIYFVNMYPVILYGKTVGGLSVVTFIKDAWDFRSGLESYTRRSGDDKKTTVPYTFDSIIAEAPLSLAVKTMAMRIANTGATVLLESESGTGKELYAQAIHNASSRRNGPFLAINCANFSKDILESELFGYEEGAFTGAKKGGKSGLFEAAGGGTILLDEISEIELPLQAKLLRVLQDHRIRRVGGVDEIAVDVRVIASCNADLNKCVEEGKFRKDLYYRLNVFPLHIPALRERPEEIRPLALGILSELSRTQNKEFSLTQEALRCLERHNWPGNVRELRNVLEFSGYLADNGVIDADNLPEIFLKPEQDDAEGGLAGKVRAFERGEILKLLYKYGNDVKGKQKAADALHISLATLYNKLGENG